MSMKHKLFSAILQGLVGCTAASAQAWPDYHLTNGTHFTSYGVEVYDPAYARNLYIDPVAILQAGGTELDDIYDGNQVYLNGGTIHASAIDANDFTWNSGDLHIEGGTHSTVYGLNGGSGRNLFIHSGAEVGATSISALPDNNRIYMGTEAMQESAGKLTVGNFNAANLRFMGGTLEVLGELKGLDHEIRSASEFVLNGVNARWDAGVRFSRNNSWGWYDSCGVTVENGASLTTSGFYAGAYNSAARFGIEVAGTGSLWKAGGIQLGDGFDSGHSITISGGGTVSNGSCLVGGYYSRNNRIEVLGEGSRFINTSTIEVGESRARENRLVVADGGFASCRNATIGGGLGSSGNGVEIRGSGSQWNIAGGLTIGVYGAWNSLSILDGGEVASSSAFIGVHGQAPYDASGNSVAVSGAGSKWNNLGVITIGGGDSAGGGNGLTISSGAEVVALGGVVINGSGNHLKLNAGGRLVVGTAFDASMEGFHFNSGSELSVEGQLSGLATLGAGCRLETANLLGDLTVHGTFAPGNSPADSTMHGALAIAADGTLEMELGGYAPGTGYDRLTVTGLSTLDGLLDILFLNGFAPTNGASFDLFNWDGGVSGAFADINTPTLSGGLHWDTSELYSTGQLSVIPEPGSVGLMGIGFGILLFARRHPRRRKTAAPPLAKDCGCDTFNHPVAQPVVPHRSCWDLLDSCDRMADRAKQKALHGLDAFLSLIMK